MKAKIKSCACTKMLCQKYQAVKTPVLSLGCTKQLLRQRYQEARNLMNKRLMRYEWYAQLKEASQFRDKRTTIISSFFINLLALVFPLTLMQVYDRIIPNRAYATLVILVIGVVVATVLEAILNISRSYINLWDDTKYEYKLGKKALSNLMHVPLYLYEKTDIGTRIKQFAILDQIRGFYNNQLFVSICDIPFLIIFLLVIEYIGGWLFLIPLLLGAALIYTAFHFIHQWRGFLQEKLTQESKESDFLINVLSNIHTTKSLGIENLLMRRYEKLQNTNDAVHFASAVQQGDLSTLKSVAGQANIILLATFGTLSVMQGSLGLGSLIACILLGGRFMMPLLRAINAFTKWKMLNIVRGQLDGVLDISTQSDIKTPVSKSALELKQVGYLYNKKITGNWAFKDLNLKIPSKKIISIVGNNQEDKEKLLNILATITQPTEGAYFIDGKNVDQFQNYHLRSSVALLTKTGHLFHGSIMSNLSAFSDANIPEAKKLAEQLGLDLIVAKLPSGYDTLVGDKAVDALPGGVINLIYIIRALVGKPKIILFDEANTSLDGQLMRKLISFLATLKKSATIIILSRTTDTLNIADIVYELKDQTLQKVERTINDKA